MKAHTPRPPIFKLVVRRGLSGLGLFAAEDIPRGRFIVQYVGPIIDDAEADRIGGSYLYDLGGGWNIDGSSRKNLARYANHSCKPNAQAWQEGRKITIWSRRRIAAGEEITYDYGKGYSSTFTQCRCNAHRRSGPSTKSRA